MLGNGLTHLLSLLKNWFKPVLHCLYWNCVFVRRTWSNLQCVFDDINQRLSCWHWGVTHYECSNNSFELCDTYLSISPPLLFLWLNIYCYVTFAGSELLRSTQRPPSQRSSAATRHVTFVHEETDGENSKNICSSFR